MIAKTLTKAFIGALGLAALATSAYAATYTLYITKNGQKTAYHGNFSSWKECNDFRYREDNERYFRSIGVGTSCEAD